MERRRHGDDGAVVPFVAIAMTLLVTMAAFAVDLGMQRVARRDMQALADVIALDMVRQVDGRTHAVIKATSTWRSGLRDSLHNNLAAEGVAYSAITVQQHQEQLTATVTGDALRVVVELGSYDEAGVFTVGPYPDVPTAVRVVASTTVDFAFAPGSGGASRTAVAETEANSCFTVGSFVAGLSSASGTVTSLLNPILGDTSLGVASYQALARAQVSFLDLVDAPSIDVGTLDGLLEADDITVGDLVLATISALQDQGDDRSLAAADVLDGLVTTTVVGDVVVDVGDVVDLTTADDGVLDTNITVLDLVGGAASVANGTNFVGAPRIDLDLPDLASTSQTLSIIEGPHLACGGAGASARTAQVQLTAGGTVSRSVTVPLGGTVSISGPLSLTVDLGSATGTLGSVTCDPDVLPVSVSTALSSMTQSLGLTVGGDDIGLGSNLVPGVPGLVTADIGYTQTIASSLSKQASTGQTLTWTIPTSDSYDTVKQTTSTSSALPSATTYAPADLAVTDVRVGGIPVTSLLILPSLRTAVVNAANSAASTLIGSSGVVGTAVSSLVSGTVDPLITRSNTVVGSLAGALGLDIAGADVTVLRYAVCNSPVLRG